MDLTNSLSVEMNGSVFPLVVVVVVAAAAVTTGEAAADDGEETTRAAAEDWCCWTASLLAERMTVEAGCCFFEADGVAVDGLGPLLPLPKTRFFGGRLRRPPGVVELLVHPDDDAED